MVRFIPRYFILFEAISQHISILTRHLSSAQEPHVAGAAVLDRASLHSAGHRKVVREGLSEEVISEQGPGGKKVSQAVK